MIGSVLIGAGDLYEAVGELGQGCVAWVGWSSYHLLIVSTYALSWDINIGGVIWLEVVLADL